MSDTFPLASLWAAQVAKGGKWSGTQEDLARAVGEITLETSITGASTLTVTLSDPQWKLLTSGLFKVEDGVITPLEVDFPPDGPRESTWRLCAVEGTTDLNGPNVTLTLEDVIVAYLRDHWGPLTVPPGTMSRAQFFAKLIAQVKIVGINFVCPALHRGLPEAVTPVGKKLPTKVQKDVADRQRNAKKGIGDGVKLTVRGKPISKSQIRQANILLDEAEQLKAGTIAARALIFAAIAESSLTAITTPNSSGYWGVLQGASGQNGTPRNWPDPTDSAGMADSFLKGGRGFQSGGAMALSRTVSDPIEIAVRVEVPSNWPDNAYAHEGDKTYPQWLPEATAIVAAYGGGSLGSQDASDTSSLPQDDNSQLSRGTTDNPDEDSWDCMNRLAEAVNWRLFSNGESVYFMDDPQLIARQPSVYISRVDNRWVSHKTGGKKVHDTVASCNFTVDNTAFTFQDGAIIKGKTRRRTRLAKPETPSQVQLNLICGIDDYRAGEVFVFQDCGVIDGRWIVQDATRNCLTENFTRFTLIPATAPTPEQKASGGQQAPAQSSPPAKSGPSGTTVPNADWNPSGKPIAKWIVPVLTWAAANGWDGVVVSGFRTAAEQIKAANDYAKSLGKPVSAIYPDGPLASNHCKTQYPGGAVDVTNSAQLAQVLKGYPDKPNLVWGGPTIEDSVHFSGNGH